MMDRWSPVKLKMPKKLAKIGIGVIDSDSILICGGIYGNEENEYTYLDDAFKLNLRAMTFTEMPPMNEKRIHYLSMPKIGNKIYAIGGQFSGKCECFNTDSETWTEIASYSEVQQGDLQTFSLITL